MTVLCVPISLDSGSANRGVYDEGGAAALTLDNSRLEVYDFEMAQINGSTQGQTLVLNLASSPESELESGLDSGLESGLVRF